MAVIRKLETPPEEQYHPEPLPPKHNRVAHDDSNWLISYADMMTLLCVFYIMLFSMSTVKTNEFEKVKKQVAEHFGQHYTSPTEDLGKFMTNVIQEAGVQKDTSISSDGTSVSIVFHSTLLFGSMSAEISKDGEAIMKKIIVSLGEKQKTLGKQYKVVVEGHTDSQPILGGPFPSNWELSSSRATRVVRMFLDNNYQAGNLLAIGYADTQPVAPSRNPDGTWNEANLSKNRRVVLRVLLPEVDSIPWSGVAKPDGAPASTNQQPAKPVAPTGQTMPVAPKTAP
ncbi:MAG: OmpA family protein [Bdellovibrionales bacterium]|nr:OmpA family protein [Bdellovibrionales bacterium]